MLAASLISVLPDTTSRSAVSLVPATQTQPPYSPRMRVQDDQGRPPARQIFEETLSGARPQPFIPRLRSDPPPFPAVPHSLREFRELEGDERRHKRLREFWSRLPKRDGNHGVDEEAVARAYPVKRDGDLTAESARQLDEMYEDELLGRCGVHMRGPFSRRVSWPEFEKYADAKEMGTCVVSCGCWLSGGG